MSYRPSDTTVAPVDHPTGAIACCLARRSFAHDSTFLTAKAAMAATVTTYRTGMPHCDDCSAATAHVTPNANQVMAVATPNAAPTRTCGQV